MPITVNCAPNSHPLSALTASGLGLEAQQEARAVLVRELRKAG